jgi:hypothetical protein
MARALLLVKRIMARMAMPHGRTKGCPSGGGSGTPALQAIYKRGPVFNFFVAHASCGGGKKYSHLRSRIPTSFGVAN